MNFGQSKGVFEIIQIWQASIQNLSRHIVSLEGHINSLIIQLIFIAQVPIFWCNILLLI